MWLSDYLYGYGMSLMIYATGIVVTSCDLGLTQEDQEKFKW
jgi:hypothetical protein